jgi:hypothetical protein
MAYVVTFRKSPVTTGSTLIQATTLLNEVSCFEPFAPSDFKKILKIWTRDYLRHAPADNELDNWTFYRRKDMTGSDALYRTLVARKVTQITVPEKYMDDQGTERTRRRPVWETEMRGWFFMIGTSTAGAVADLIDYEAITRTLFTNPELGNEIAIPTDGYQSIHELLGFFLKPVAGTVPLTTPSTTNIGLGNPNDI